MVKALVMVEALDVALAALAINYYYFLRSAHAIKHVGVPHVDVQT